MTKTRRWNKAIAFLLAVLMVLGSVPTAFAAEGEESNVSPLADTPGVAEVTDFAGLKTAVEDATIHEIIVQNDIILDETLTIAPRSSLTITKVIGADPVTLTYGKIDDGRHFIFDTTGGDYKLNLTGVTLQGGVWGGGGLALIGNGSIEVVGSSAAKDGTVFKQNSSDSSGGAIWIEAAHVLLEDILFDSNGAVGYGGAIAVSEENETVEITNCVFQNNETLPDDMGISRGGAIGAKDQNDNATSSSQVVISSSDFLSNKVGGFDEDNVGLVSGGAVYLGYGRQGIFVGGNYNNNTSPNDGGALSLQQLVSEDDHHSITGLTSSFLNITPSFQQNRAQRGGAIYIGEYARVDIELASFNTNWASTDGGAVYIDHDPEEDENATDNYVTIFNDSSMVNNTADRHGGAIYVADRYSLLRSEEVAFRNNRSIRGVVWNEQAASAYRDQYYNNVVEHSDFPYTDVSHNTDWTYSNAYNNDDINMQGAAASIVEKEITQIWRYSETAGEYVQIFDSDSDDITDMTVAVGDHIYYELSVTNHSDYAYTSPLTIIDELDEHVKYIKADPEDINAYDEGEHTYTWELDGINYSEVLTLEIQVEVLESAVDQNYVVNRVTTERGEGTPPTEEPPVYIPMEGYFFKQVTTINGASADETDVVTEKDLIRYTIPYKAPAGQGITQVVIVDTIPEGTTIEDVDNDSGTVTVSGREITWTIDVGEADGETYVGEVYVVLSVNEDDDWDNRAKFTNEAEITYYTATGEYGSESDEVTNPLGAEMQKRVTSINGDTNVNSDTPVGIGDIITYEITYTPPKGTTVITITDTLPTGLKYSDELNTKYASYLDISAAPVYQWKIPIDKDEGKIEITAEVVGAPSDTSDLVFVNGATVTYTGGGNTKTEADEETNPFRTAAAKTVVDINGVKDVNSNTPVGAKDVITYEITYEAPAGTETIVITDELPENVTYVSSSHTPEDDANPIKWVITKGSSDDTGIIEVTIEVDSVPDYPENPESGYVHELVNKATIEYLSDEPDFPTIPAEESSTSNPYRDGAAKLVAEINGYDDISEKTPVGVGDVITYYITYTPPAGTKTITITDELPEGVVHVGSKPKAEQNNNGAYEWVIEVGSADDTGWVSITVRVDSIPDGEDYLVNTATVRYDDDDDTEEEPDDSRPYRRDAKKVAKVINGDDTVSEATPVGVGDIITYSITFSPPAGAQTVTITDTLPDNVEYVSSSPRATALAGGTYEWEIDVDTMDGPHGEVTITVQILFIPDGETVLYNTANIDYGDAGDPENPDTENPYRTQAAKTVTDINGDDKVNSETAVGVGDVITYDITYTAPAGTEKIIVTDYLPDGVEHVSSNPPGTVSGNTVTWEIDADNDKGVVTVTIRVIEIPDYPGNPEDGYVHKLVNKATVEYEGDDLPPEIEPEEPGEENPYREPAAKLVADINGYTNIHDATPVGVGDVITYEISYTAPAGTTQVIITDELPDNVRYISSQPNAQLNADGAYEWIIDVVEYTGSVSITVEVVSIPDGEEYLVNTATVRYDDNDDTEEKPDKPIPYRRDAEKVAQTINGDDTVSEATPVGVGDIVTYVITFSPPAGAQTVTIIDKLPDNVRFVRSTPSATVTAEGAYQWEIDVETMDGPHGEISVTVEIVSIPEGETVLRNVAEIDYGDAGDPEDPETENPYRKGAAKTVSSINGVTGIDETAAVGVGDQVTYDITYTAPAGTETITITDYLPEGVEYVSSSPEAEEISLNTEYRWTIEAGSEDDTGVVSITVKIESIPDGATELVNSAEVTYDDKEPEIPEEPIPYRDEAEKVAIDVNGVEADKTTTVGEGDTITYAITYTAPEGTETITITDDLAEGVEYVSSSPEANEVKDDTVTWVIDGAEDTGKVTITVKVNEIPDGVTTLYNSAHVEYDGPSDAEPEDPDTENPVRGKSSKTIYSINAMDGVDSDSPVGVGDVITYTITYDAPEGTETITITDYMPEGVRHVTSIPLAEEVETGVYQWIIEAGSEEDTGSVSITIQIQEIPEGGGELINRAEVQFDDRDPEVPVKPNPYRDEAEKRTVSVNNVAADETTPVGEGDEITYTISYTPPVGTETITITDYLAEGVEYVSSSPEADESEDGTVVWTIDAADDGGEVSITVRIVEIPEGVDTLVNRANVDYGDYGEPEDPETENPYRNSAAKTISGINGETGVDSESPVGIGDVITYDITYTAPAGTETITITDYLPEGVAYVSSSPEAEEITPDAEYRWTIEAGSEDDTGKVTITIEIVDIPAGATDLVNSAEVEFDDGEPEKPVEPNPYRDEAEKYVLSVNGASAGAGTLVGVGDVITYEITYMAPVGTETITITDYLPEGVAYVRSTPEATDVTDDTVTWVIDAAEDEGKVSVTLRIESIPDGVDTLVNRAKVDYNGYGEPEEPETENPYRNRAAKTIRSVNGDTDVSSETVVRQGDEITYDITYTAPAGTETITIEDYLPDGVQYVSSSPAASLSLESGAYRWVIQAGSAQDTGTVSITIRIVSLPEGTETLVNRAKVWFDDSETPEEPDTENPYWSGPQKTINNATSVVGIGDQLTYTISYYNYLDTAATIVITDTLSQYLNFVSASNSGSYNTNSRTVTWTLNNVPAGTRGEVTLRVEIADNALGGVVIQNQATVAVNGEGETTGPVEKPVTLTKSVASSSEAGVNGATVQPGEQVTYEIRYHNENSSSASASIVDQLDENVTFVGAVDGNGNSVGSYDRQSHTFTLSRTTVASGATLVVHLTVEVKDSAANGTIRNKATLTVGSTTKDSNEVVNPVGDARQYTVTFHLNNDYADRDVYRTDTVLYGEQVSRPSNPADIEINPDADDSEISYYTFVDWYTEASCNTLYNFDTAVTGDLHLYADWDSQAGLAKDPEEPEIFSEHHFAYLVGYPNDDGTITQVRPENPISRAEVATIFLRIITDELREEYWTKDNEYPDVTLGEDWFNNAASTMSNYGLFEGYEDGYYRGNNNISRAEFATVISRFLPEEWDGENRFSDVPDDEWYTEAINIAAQEGWIQGDPEGTFRPEDDITRAEVAIIVNRIRGSAPLTSNDLHEDMLTWEDNPHPDNGGKYYYFDIQEATNSHFYDFHEGSTSHEYWTELRENRNWVVLQQDDATAEMLYEGEESWNERAPGYVAEED